MLSPNAMKIMAGAATGGIGAGMLAKNYASKNQDMDGSDRLAFTGSSVIAGIAGGAVLGKIGPGRIARGVSKGARGIARGISDARTIAKGASSLATKLGAGKAPMLGGPMKLLALAAATIGLTAYGARSKTPTNAYASRNEDGETEYGQQHSVKERVSMMKSHGDMVFGMHNTRHG